MADSPSVLLYVNHVEVGDSLEWSLSTEEVLGGPGRATMTIQDRLNAFQPEARQDVKAVLASGPLTGWVLFRGQILSDPIVLQTGLNWRKWSFTCVDYSFEFDWRLVGAFDGKTWMDTSGLGVYVNIDPFAATLDTDKLTIQNWFDHYIRVDGAAIGTSTYVGEYLTDFTTITPSYDTLKGAVDKVAAYVAGNLQYWLDPDLEFHWALIPNWQDLIQASIDAVDSMSLMAPSTPSNLTTDLGFAPYEVSDVYQDPEPMDPDRIGFHSLSIELDGSNMPEQIYVRGGTGYVYNADPIPATDDTKTVVKVPVQGTEGTYQLTITENPTKLWHVDSTGYVSVTYASVGTGGPWPVKFIHVAWNATRNKGGYYWKFLSGPHQGLLADDHTNGLAGYGGIRVEFTPTGTGPTPDPQIGIGGTGFVGEVDQDPNKRQAYLQAPVSVTRELRDSLGNQALYRGQYPTLRGSVEVTGYDGWRAGQLMKVTDARLPSYLNAKYYVIQRVGTKLIQETTLRRYTLDFGDGPSSRYSYKSARFDAGWPPPANQLFIDAHDLTPGPNNSQTIKAQLVNGLGEPWRIAGKVVEWSFECYNSNGVLQTGQGTINPEVSVTNQDGRAHTTLTTGPGLNLVYYVFGAVRAV